MNSIKIGGVPEHFNLPWHYALEKKYFKEKGIELEWIDFPGGTGAMNLALRNGEIDAAVILTEGIVADIIKGNTSRIVQWYVLSPLIWGIHVAAKSTIQNENHFANKKYAISRFGSGSHLMAYVDASQRGQSLKPEQFVVVDNFEGAVKSLTSKESNLFLWEKWMTKPFVDNGIFRRISECPTPWPSFVIAVREPYLHQHESIISDTLKIIQDSCKEFKSLPNAEEIISRKFNLFREDVHEWMKLIRWQTEKNFDAKPLENAVKTLYSLNLIKEVKPVDELIFKPRT